LSEADAGSDAFALQTRARPDGDHFVLTGRKLWITNAAEADLFIVFATIDPAAGYRGITAFIVDRDTPGLTVGRREHKLGIRASSTCEVVLDECRIAAGRVLGAIGQGYKVAMETLNEGRIGIGAQMVGLAAGALDAAVAHVTTRRQFGRPIAEFQGVQFQIARLAAEIESTRLLVYNAARLADVGRPFITEAAMCKLLASETAERAASLAVNLLGGQGFVRDGRVEKLYRDAKIGQIYEGTSNLQLLTIAKQILPS
jgi:alkylation response protein AidB-like acyl-CoA dehydrogenase